MNPLDRIAEERIRNAAAEGAFDDLPAKGKPLPPEDMDGVPEDLRLAWRVLRNAICLPEELERRRSVARLGDLLASCTDPEQAAELRRELRAERLRLDLLRERRR